MNCDQLKAFNNVMPGSAPRFYITGGLTMPDAGYKIELSRSGTDFNPAIISIDFHVTRLDGEWQAEPACIDVERFDYTYKEKEELFQTVQFFYEDKPAGEVSVQTVS